MIVKLELKLIRNNLKIQICMEVKYFYLKSHLLGIY